MERYVKYISKNRSGAALYPIGLCLHETATPGATAMNEFVYFNNGAGGRKASVHGFVDWDMYVQTMPYNEMAWHAGYSANTRYIGIEMCRPKSHNVTQFTAMYNNTVVIFAELCIRYGWTSTNITTHHECTLRWRETDHTDPTALLKEYGKNIDIFRNDVTLKIAELKGELTMSQYTELKGMLDTQAAKIAELEKKTTPFIYAYIDDNTAKIAEDANAALEAAMKKGVLKGTGGPLGLNLTEDLVRIHIWNYRMGLYN